MAQVVMQALSNTAKCYGGIALLSICSCCRSDTSDSSAADDHWKHVKPSALILGANHQCNVIHG
jgi:hypothetical protein